MNYKEHLEDLNERLKLDSDYAIDDFDILELLLSKVSSKDVRKTSNILFNDFGTFRSILEQDVSVLVAKGLETQEALFLKLIRKSVREFLEPDLRVKPCLSSPKSVTNYLRAILGGLDREHFMILLLNNRNELIHKEVLFIGTVDQVQVYPREIIRLAIIHNASSIIVAHNHPSENSKPSQDDRDLTNSLKRICSNVNLRVHDHLIVTKDQVYSMANERVV